MSQIIVLIADDEEADLVLAKRVLGKMDQEFDIHAVSLGEEVLAFFKQEDPFEGVPRPQLLLLDMNFPDTNAYEVLQDLKANDFQTTSGIILLTGLVNETVIQTLDVLDLHVPTIQKDQFSRVGPAAILSALNSSPS